MGKMVRLDRFLAQAGIGSRAEVKKLIRSGRILVNDVPAQRGEHKIDEESDVILMDGRKVSSMTVPTVMLNKPAGVVSATQDNHDRTVIDLISEPWAEKLFPVGRLDKDTEGLLLLTSDGMMSHELLSPKKHVVKTYFAIVSGDIDEGLCGQFLEGLDIGEKRKTLPAELIFLNDEMKDVQENPPKEQAEFWRLGISEHDLGRCGENECCIVISITEGKFHQIKRMFEAVGREVHFLKRIAMGNLVLDPDLEPGQYRALSDDEISMLR